MYFVGLANLFAYYVIPVLVPLFIISKLWMKYYDTGEDDDYKDFSKEEKGAIEMIKSMDELEGGT